MNESGTVPARARKLAPDPLQGAWEDPVPERRAAAQRTRLLRQPRHIAPGIVDRLPRPKER